MKRFLLQLSGVALASLFILPEWAVADDWPQWRGPNRDGICAETGLLESWPEAGPPRAWKAKGLGGGYSSPSIVDEKVFGTGYSDEKEIVWALSAADGKKLWSTPTGKVAELYEEVDYAEGPRATPTVDGGFVFVIGAAGHLSCLEAEKGTLVWTRNLVTDLGGKLMSDWGYSEAPLVDSDKVICTPGGPKGAVAALDRKTGEVIWQSKDLQDPAGYTSLVAAEIGGVKQYVVLTGASVAGINPKDGGVLWQEKRIGRTAVVPTPIVNGNHVLVSSGYAVGSQLFEVSESGGTFAVKKVYASKKLKNDFGGVIKIGDQVYGSSGVVLVCMDFNTGEDVWKKRTIGGGGLLYADGHFYLRNDRGLVALLKATPEALVEKGQFEESDRSDHKSWPTPVISNGRLYLRDQGTMTCYDVRKK